jgi:hypothetical protein
MISLVSAPQCLLRDPHPTRFAGRPPPFQGDVSSNEITLGQSEIEAQIVSFNFTNALICAGASRMRMGEYLESYCQRLRIPNRLWTGRLGRHAIPAVGASAIPAHRRSGWRNQLSLVVSRIRAGAAVGMKAVAQTDRYQELDIRGADS